MALRTFKHNFSIFSDVSNFTAGKETDVLLSEGPYQAVVVVIIVLATGLISLVTITGNILVLLSIIMNRSLQTINNYFLFSLACADLIIAVSSMNLYTVYILLGYWPLGAVVCDLWLVLDYVACDASAFHLIVISFDRYFCITKPLSYPARRTTRTASLMIAAAWVLSFVLWAPAILFWQFIVGERTVPEGECYIPFLSNPTIILITSIVFFYLPVTIMSLLYWQISRASKSRMKSGKQEPKQDNLSSNKAGTYITTPRNDDYLKTHHTEKSQNDGPGGVREEEISEVPADFEENPKALSLNTSIVKQRPKKKAMSSREKKVTRTAMAILVAFLVTWTPYNIMVLITTFCPTCVPSSMWTFGCWICYLNSTINPACYALCNVSFRKTFKQLLLCQHKDIRLGR